MKEKTKPDALQLAAEQEQALLDLANGRIKIGKLPVEPFVRGYAMLREQHAQIKHLEQLLAAAAPSARK